MDVLIGVALLNLGGIQLSKRLKIKGGGAYFLCMCLVLMTIWTGSLFNLLLPSTIICMLAVLGINIYSLVRKGAKQWLCDAKEYFTLPVWLCNASSVVFTIIYAIQKPLFYYWDEYSFWGISARILKDTNRLYTIGKSSLLDMNSLPSGNAILNYFFQFFSPDFTDYKLLLAYAFLFFAVFALAAELIIHYNNSLKQGILLYFALLLTPFMSIAHLPKPDFSTLSYAYGTSMCDFTIPVVILGVISMFLLKPKSLWFLAVLAFLTTIKNTSIFFAVLSGLVICCFILFAKIEKTALVKRLLLCAVIIIVPLIVSFAWSTHVKVYDLPIVQGKYDLSASIDSDEAAQTDSEAKPPLTRGQRYVQVLQEMQNQFLSGGITTVANDRVLIILLLIISFGAVFLAKKGNRLCVFFIALGLFAGCIVYAVTISYFIAGFGDGMVEYSRYMSSYYFAWLYISLLLFILCLKGKELSAQLALLCTAFLGFSALYNTKIDYTVLNAPDNAYTQQLEIEKELALPKSVIKKTDRVLIVFLDQDTDTYFIYRYRLMPAIISADTKNTGIDFSINFRTSVKPTDKRTYYNVASPEVFTEIMRDYFDYIYVIEPDKEFKRDYGKLFSDGMQQKTLYEITADSSYPMKAVTYDAK